jgi:putative Mn2+ efflux pump MntP
MRKLIRLAVYTSIDTLFVGAGFSLLEIAFSGVVLLSSVISFITVFLAMEIGYNLGASYQRVVGMLGGALMIIFSMYLMAVLVLKFVI